MIDNTMRRILRYLLIATFVCGCCRVHGDASEPAPSSEEPVSPLSRIFNNRALQDSLNAFMEDSRKASMDTLVYSVCISTSNPSFTRIVDTMVYFITDDKIRTFYDPWGRQEHRIIGAVQYGNEILGMSYCGYSPSDSLVNESLFDKRLWDKCMKKYRKNEDIDLGKMASDNRYKFVNADSLILLERNRNPHFFGNEIKR